MSQLVLKRWSSDASGDHRWRLEIASLEDGVFVWQLIQYLAEYKVSSSCEKMLVRYAAFGTV